MTRNGDDDGFNDDAPTRPGIHTPGNGSEMRDEGDDAIPPPEFVAERLDRFAKSLAGTFLVVRRLRRLVLAGRGNPVAFIEAAEKFEELGDIAPGAGRALRYFVPFMLYDDQKPEGGQ